METKPTRRIAVEPKSGRYESLEQAVVAGGGTLSPIEVAEGLVWTDPSAAQEFPGYRDRAQSLEWVALPFAGIEPFVPYLRNDMRWTCAKGVYATPVAEHVLALGLAGLREVVTYSKQSAWTAQAGANLVGGRVCIFGGGGITTELVRLLQPFGCSITVVRRSIEQMSDVDRVLPLEQRLAAVEGADLVVLALALTPKTRHVADGALFAAMEPHAWLVNVARGGHVDHDALLSALQSGSIGGAALDVTEPEPLPAKHELWSHPRVVITPHVGNTPEMGVPLLASNIEANVRRFIAGEELLGPVDVEAGY